MARVVFVQRLAFEYLGVAQLAAVLKQHGHRVQVVVAPHASLAAEEARALQPDLVCFSCTTGAHLWCLDVARRIKSAALAAVVVLGGPHPTFFPEIVHRPEVDAICVGEGEQCLAELAARLDAGESLEGVPNLWRVVEGEEQRGELARLCANLDALPVADRGVYYRRYPFLNLSRKAFFAGRGCPFGCTFCFNHKLRELYHGKGPYVRLRSPERVVDEIEGVRRRFGLATVYMQDDTFTLNKRWLGEFAERYARRVRLPLVCLGRADTIDAEVAGALKDMNCKGVFLGVESGDERVRREVLGKNVSDDQIRRAVALLKRKGMRIRTYNMLGLPGESLDEAWQTVRLNAELGAEFPWCAIFQPYARTQLGDLAARMGLVDADVGQTFFQGSPLALPHRREIENLHKLFFVAANAPALAPLLRRLIKLPGNPLFDWIFRATYAWGYMRTERLRIGEVLSIAMRNAGPMFK